MDTPYYLIDENRLVENLKKIQTLREKSGTRSVLALKCFSTWTVFDTIRQYMDGTTSSSLYEAKLGYDTFGKEVHAYSVAFSKADIIQLKKYADKIIFNSVAQLKTFYPDVSHLDIGLRLNPQISYSDFDLANPARQYSRLGVIDIQDVWAVSHLIKGVMFHYNCENKDFENFSTLLDMISHTYGELLHQLEWVSLGGGISFTQEDYPLEHFSTKLTAFSTHFNIQVYLEPGEAVIANTTTLVTTVLDIVHNERDIAIIDSSIEAHTLDLLTYQEQAKITGDRHGAHCYQIAGNSCLAGDIFGECCFNVPLRVGDRIIIEDVGGYTMVKTNWFNGVKMPSIVIKRRNGDMNIVKTSGYIDFKNHLSSVSD
ncbi:MAG: carboxynorspermidine decarboxylase [Thiomargarita sp.]|nr:carboxynorspermidine decarboxylase [Thiomargarita sp.]